MPSVEEPGMQAITLILVCAGAVLSLAWVALGVFSTLTGRDPFPRAVRDRLRRKPASPDDFRLHGVGLILNGAALAMIASYVVINVVVRLALTPAGVWFAYVGQESSFDFPTPRSPS